MAAGAGSRAGAATPPAARGWLRAPRVRLSTRFPLGLFRAWSYWQPDCRVLVYPFPEQDAPPLPMAGAAAVPTAAAAPGSDDFAGVRSYQPGDPLRQLAWRQIARLDPELGGQLVTKHFEGGAADELVLDFDALPPRLDLEAAPVAHDALGAGSGAARPALCVPARPHALRHRRSAPRTRPPACARWRCTASRRNA